MQTSFLDFEVSSHLIIDEGLISHNMVRRQRSPTNVFFSYTNTGVESIKYADFEPPSTTFITR